MATTRLRLDDMPDNLKDIKKKEYLEESGSDVEVSLLLPDGTEETRTFKMGTLVSYLKAYVESKYGYSVKTQVLSMNDHPMLDPFCLSDIPTLKESETNFIKVTVMLLEKISRHLATKVE